MSRHAPAPVLIATLASLYLAPAALAMLVRDATFGTAGEAILSGYDDAENASATAVVVQPDGQLVVAAKLSPLGMPASVMVARFDGAGALDPRFGVGGIVELFTGDPQSRSYENPVLALDGDGKILIASGRNLSQLVPADLVVARLLPDGSLDGAFGSGGVVATSAGVVARGVAVQDDGRIVVAGTDFHMAVVARYLPDGTLDPTFGSGGLVTDPTFAATALAIQQDGRILVAGNSYPDFDLVLTRHLNDGSPDPAFGGGAGVRIDLGGASQVNGMLVDPDGNIVVAGARHPGECFCAVASQALFARFLPDGAPDPGFGTGGFTEFPIGANRAEIAGLVRRADGILLGIGGLFFGPSMAIAAVTPDGAVDATIHPCAQVVADGRAAAGVIQPDGRVVAVGLTKRGFTVRRWVEVPSVPCRTADRARVRVKNRSVPFFATDQVLLKWKGSGTLAEFGSPTTVSDLAFCLLDDAGAPTLRLVLHAPAGDVGCDSSPCWSAGATGYKYLRRTDLGAGGQLLFRTGIAVKKGMAALKAVVKRGDLQLANTLPIAGSGIVRVARSDGSACWEAAFETPQRNSADAYDARVP